MSVDMLQAALDGNAEVVAAAKEFADDIFGPDLTPLQRYVFRSMERLAAADELATGDFVEAVRRYARAKQFQAVVATGAL